MSDISTALSILTMAATLVAHTAAYGQVKTTVSAAKQSYADIGAIVLTITIENTSAEPVTIATREHDPPVVLLLIDDRGRNRIVSGPDVYRKDGRTVRNRIFTLKAHEIRSYTTGLAALLLRGQGLAKLGPGDLQIQVSVPRVYRDSSGQYHTELIKSNTITVSAEH